jgi:ABC-type cobalamin/Fe3+-siderophores transport system ATPase subunit
MECGKLVMTGSPKEVFTIEAIEKVFRVRVNIGENPETRKLLITT